MSQQVDVILTNDVVSLRLEYGRECQRIGDRLQSFLAPAFHASDGSAAVDFALSLREFRIFPPRLLELCTRDVCVRRSPKAMFDLSLRVYERDNIRVGVDVYTETAFSVDLTTGAVIAYIGDKSFIHLIEFIRYGALLLEEARGTVLLHASAVIGRDGVVPVIGAKGAGKTTTLFKLVHEAGLQFFTGDKLLLRAPPDPVRAWPDYPHVGIGTLKGFPALAQELGVQPHCEDGGLKPDDYKELIDPQRFAAAMRSAETGRCWRIASVIFPEIGAGVAEISRVPEEAKNIGSLAAFVEYPFEFTPGHWHGLFAAATRTARLFDPAVLQPLLAAPWYRLRGTASLQSVILA